MRQSMQNTFPQLFLGPRKELQQTAWQTLRAVAVVPVLKLAGWGECQLDVFSRVPHRHFA
ncbi:hypothetical protein RBWH47_01873 [Rhodopirellula baltica WH47]|uniref:Uncharacterized protein n=1 Tax=Rhodopirellula baltica WH47 TaxID=991778 RepID=F2AXG5_RHOBT|nr:hypothetical protein RBWH47_01873 [Rhodopirellula baltica WH47]